MSSSAEIGFRGHHVLVEAEKDGVVRHIARSFEQLLVTAQGQSCSRETLRAQRSGDGFELTLDGERIFAHEELEEVVRVLRHEIIDSFVRAHPELLWLHAGGAVHGGRAVLFVGRFGRGKSTLVTQLCRRGWSYLSDDIVPVDLATRRLIPFPLTPVVREDSGQELPRERLTELRKVRVDLPRSRFHRSPVPIGGIVFPTYRAGTRATLDQYSPAAITLDLIREGINKERMAAETVALCARLVDEVPVLPVSFSDAEAAADLIVRTLGMDAASSRSLFQKAGKSIYADLQVRFGGLLSRAH